MLRNKPESEAERLHREELEIEEQRQLERGSVKQWFGLLFGRVERLRAFCRRQAPNPIVVRELALVAEASSKLVTGLLDLGEGGNPFWVGPERYQILPKDSWGYINERIVWESVQDAISRLVRLAEVMQRPHTEVNANDIATELKLIEGSVLDARVPFQR